MSRATEDQLGILHKQLAETFSEALEQSSTASALLLVEREDPLPNDVTNFLMDLTTVNPSLLTAITKFLKDNNITADPGEDTDLAVLKDQLDAKRQRGKVLNIPLGD